MEEIVSIPKDVEVKINDTQISVKGKKGELKKTFNDPRFLGEIEFNVNDNEFTVKSKSDRKKVLAMTGTIAAHVKNMITGVTVGYKFTMKIVYTHFPITVVIKNSEVEVKNFLAEKGLRKARIMDNCEVKADKEFITVTGNNIENVSQTVANIESACKLTRRDRRIFIDGIYVSEKALENGEKL